MSAPGGRGAQAGAGSLFEPSSIVLVPGRGDEAGARLARVRERLRAGGYEGPVRVRSGREPGEWGDTRGLEVVVGEAPPSGGPSGGRVVLPCGEPAGLMNPRLGLVCVDPGPWPLPPTPEPGPVALLGESGAMGLHAAAALAERDLGLSVWASARALPEVGLPELVAWALRDPETEVVAAHGLHPGEAGEAERALALAREHRKPVVVLGDALGGGAADGAGVPVYRTERLGEWLDVVQACSGNRFPRGGGMVVVSACEESGRLLARQARSLGLEPVGGEGPEEGVHPLRMAELREGARLEPRLTGLLRRPDCDVLLLFLGALGRPGAPAEEILQVLERLRPEHPERLMVVVADLDSESRRRVEAGGWLAVAEPERALRATAALLALSGPLFRDQRRPRRSGRS